jgi:hypothetical protein
MGNPGPEPERDRAAGISLTTKEEEDTHKHQRGDPLQDHGKELDVRERSHEGPWQEEEEREW